LLSVENNTPSFPELALTIRMLKAPIPRATILNAENTRNRVKAKYQIRFMTKGRDYQP
jgi:hypothetical protein